MRTTLAALAFAVGLCIAGAAHSACWVDENNLAAGLRPEWACKTQNDIGAAAHAEDIPLPPGYFELTPTNDTWMRTDPAIITKLDEALDILSKMNERQKSVVVKQHDEIVQKISKRLDAIEQLIHNCFGNLDLGYYDCVGR